MFTTPCKKVIKAPSIYSRIRANVCSTCLSSDRSLYAIRNLPELRYLCNGVVFSTEDRICYECQAILTKTLKFKKRAVKAMAVLSSLRPQHTTRHGHHIDIYSLSSLTCSNVKNTFDAEYDFSTNNIIQTLKVENIKVDYEDEIDGIRDSGEAFSGSTVVQSAVDVGISLPLMKVKIELTSETEDSRSDVDECFQISPPYTSRPPQEHAPHSSAPTCNTAGTFRAGEEDSDDSEIPPESNKCISQENLPALSTAINNINMYYNGHHSTSSIEGREYEYNVQTFSEAEMLEYREEMKKAKTYAGSKHKCEKCIIGFGQQDLFEKHMESHHENSGLYMCRICEQRFPQRSSCEAHIHFHYRYYDCRQCAFRHHEENKVVLHMRCHRKYECGKCDDVPTFTNYNQYKSHTKRVHGKKVECNICEKTLASGSLNEHMKRHKGIMREYECNVCNKKYKSKTMLEYHKKVTHNQEYNEFAFCTECQIQFKCKELLKVHLRSSQRHSAARFECAECGARASNKSALLCHIEVVHLKIPRYECETCNQKFITATYLNRHKRSAHSGIKVVPKKHVCHVCGKEFTVIKSLKEHLNTHSGLRPFKCNICGDTFSYSAVLYTHNKLKHLKLKPESWKKKKKSTK